MIFYKGVLVSDLKESYIPGSVTTSYEEALIWKYRIESKKTKGAARHVRKGKSCVIAIEFDQTKLMNHEEFQRSEVKEHNRTSCWMSAVKDKAQLNTVCQYEVVNYD